jgi:hypothetical protein
MLGLVGMVGSGAAVCPGGTAFQCGCRHCVSCAATSMLVQCCLLPLAVCLLLDAVIPSLHCGHCGRPVAAGCSRTPVCGFVTGGSQLV